MIARPDPEDENPINKLTGEPMRLDETCQWTPTKPEPRGGHWYLAGVAVIAVLGAWLFSSLGLHPMLGATALWGVVAIFAVIYHHVVRRRLKARQRDLDVAQRTELEESVARAWTAPEREAPAPWTENGKG